MKLSKLIGYSLSAGLTLLSLGVADRAMALSFISDYSSEYEEYIEYIQEEYVSEEITSKDIIETFKEVVDSSDEYVFWQEDIVKIDEEFVAEEISSEDAIEITEEVVEYIEDYSYWQEDYLQEYLPELELMPVEEYIYWQVSEEPPVFVFEEYTYYWNESWYEPWQREYLPMMSFSSNDSQSTPEASTVMSLLAFSFLGAISCTKKRQSK
jgi:hypothetical protein